MFELDNNYVAKGKENKLACLNPTKIMSSKVGGNKLACSNLTKIMSQKVGEK